ncbi:MAG: hypothetical protein M3Y87_36310, partial [Myxococcota bacterium]|nr:hypothetical protein [Myxococcota bacterium]
MRRHSAWGARAATAIAISMAALALSGQAAPVVPSYAATFATEAVAADHPLASAAGAAVLA